VTTFCPSIQARAAPRIIDALRGCAGVLRGKLRGAARGLRGPARAELRGYLRGRRTRAGLEPSPKEMMQ